tara:strand:- start:217 stop:375 length:159 start_codon:yes stop_codon:yes gene_type:complete
MTDEHRQKLIRLRDALTEALKNVDAILADETQGKSVSMSDSFSEDKEKFLAP